MVDFDGGKRSGFELENGADDATDPASNDFQEAGTSYSAGTIVRSADANGVVVLPAGVSPEDITVQGRDLVINLADGTTIVIPDGAIIVPQIVIDGVAVEPATLAALLNNAEIDPEAGIQPAPSSGGNFAEAEGAIQDGFGLGDLLPYTELFFPQPEEREIIPNLVDEDPDIVIETPDNPVGVENAIATVDEDGLPARGGEGGEPEGTNAAGDGEFTSGTIVFDAPDGLSAILINGVEITDVGQSFTSPYGTLTITSINLGTGEIGFNYTLEDNTLGEEADGFFEATVVDSDGDEASASLQIIVVDDSPIAADDIGIVPAGTHDPILGNVLDNDVSGADNYPVEGGVTGFSNEGGSAEPGQSLQGEYGVLTINADGSYTYVRDFNTPGGVTETFEYSIIDQDGSASAATLVIEIEDAPDTITIPDVGDGTVVDEGGLPPRTNEPAGTGEIADNDADNNSDTSETTGSTVSFTSPDGVESITIDGVVIDANNLPQTIVSETGTLVITGYTYDPATGEGTITYEFTLGDNTSGDDTTVEFDFVITDLDGDTAEDTLTITILDDEPTAEDDTGTQQGEDAPITVNVIVNDTPGADDVQPEDIALVDETLSGEGSVTYNGDGTFTYTPAPGEEGTVTFDYTITDGDGDVATATVTIELGPDSTPEIAVEGDNDVDEAGLAARGAEPAGSDEASDSEIASGSIPISTGNDSIASLVINGVDVTAGGSITTDKGVLTVSVAEGAYSYSYELTDNTLSDPDSDSFSLTVTDSDGDTASTTLVIAIMDDEPAAENDADSIAAGEYGPATGNVMANDVEGADGAVVTSYTGNGNTGAAGSTIQGVYGTLTIDADGSYSYTRDAGTPGGVTDTFTYTITDGDGDPASADLVISIADSPTTLDLPVAGEAGTQVEEDGLAGPPAGSDAANNSEFTTGTIAYTAPDGPATVTIGGVAVTGAGQTFTGAFGTLTVDAIDAASGAITYTYQLTTNTAGDDTQDEFVVRVTDQDGDFTEDTLTIDIVDDVPTANADLDSVTEDGPLTADGNVLTGSGGSDANATDGVADVSGADDATVTGVVFGTSATDVAGDVGAAVAGAYGSIEIDADGAYIYTLDNANEFVQGLDQNESLTEVFTYTITDGDGDTSTTTVTITINGDDDGVTINGLDLDAPEVILDEDDLADGSDTTPEPLTQSGSFTVDSPDGLTTLTVGGVTVFDAASATTYPVTIDDPTYGLLTITGVATTTDATGDVVAATISYSYTLQDNSLLHTGADDGSFTDSFEVVATDTDGSTDTASLDIEIVDDVPTAQNDTAGQVVENQSIVIDALANDTFGADGVDTTDGTKVFVSVDATQGTVTYDPTTGQFTYVPAAGAGSNGNLTDSFDYVIVDADGDMSTARVDITLQPDSEPQGGETVATVDDDGLAGNNPLSTAGDQDANFGDDPADISEATFTGTLSFDVGNDTPASIAFDPALEGATAVVGQETVTYSISGSTLTATGPRGVLFTVEITDVATGEYVVTLVDNVLHDAGSDENNAFASIDFVVADSEGETTLTNLGVGFDDDAPTATDNANSVGEGEATGGNVVTDNDGNGTDVAGADDFALDGAVVGAGFVVSDPAGATLLNQSTAADGTITVVTSVGTLVVSANGDYTFTSDANTINADTSLTFTYTVEDGDGDQATANLVIDIANVAGNVTDTNAIVYEAGLDGIGSDGAGNGEFFTSGQITVTNATGPFTFTLDDPATGNYGTLTLNPDGSYSYELTSPIDGDLTGDGGDNADNPVTGQESFAYTVTDSSGNEIGTGSIDVTIVDDIPTATDQANIDVAEDLVGTIGGNVMTDGTPDTEGADGATVTSFTVGAVTTAVPQNGNSANYSDVNGTYTMDMDGNWTFDPNPNLDQSAGDIEADFTYTLTDGDGDTSTALQPITIQDGAGPLAGPPVTLELDDENLADGSNPAADDFDSDTIVFTEGSDDIVSIIFDDSATALDNLGGGLTWVRVSDTQITGSDGARLVVTLDLSVDLTTNTATVTATLNDNYDDHPDITGDDIAVLGSVNIVATDTDGDTATSSAAVSVSDDLPTITATAPAADALTVDETDLATDATADFSGLFTPDYNADNPGTVGDYTLGINVGATGLVDTETGEAVILVMNGDVVEGRSAVTDALVFTVSVDTAGTVELDQLRAVVHPDNPDQNEPVTLAAADLITLSATVTDSDGDTATATSNIAGAMTFLDDGPALTNVALLGSAEVDETAGFPTSDTSDQPIISFTADYGEDQEKSTEMSLSILNTNSGLQTAVGDQDITLVQIDTTTIQGQYGAGSVAFEITINNDINSADFGKITLTQNVALEHTVDGPEGPDHDDPLDLDGLINATVTITDGDDDSVSESVEVGGALTFLDDGPTVTLSVIEDSLTVSDSDLGSDSEGFADNFTFDGGEDGTASIAYALGVVDGTFSGLYDNATNEQILLRDNGGVIEGYTAGSDDVVFTVSVNAGTGEVTLDLIRAIDHALSNGDSDTTSTLVADDLIKLTATITDNDGDYDTQDLSIGQNLTFTDDTPTGEPTTPATLDDDALGGIAGGPDDQDPDTSNLTGTLVDPAEGFGNDGGTVAFDLGSTLPTGFRLVADPASDGVIIEQEQGTGNWVAVVTVVLDETTGSYIISQTANILHEDDAANEENEVSFTLGATLTDGDGDTALTSLTITVDDDTPTATTNTVVQLDDDVFSGNPGGTGDDANNVATSGTLSHAFGADGGSIAFDLSSAAPAGFQFVSDGADGVLIQQDQGAGFVTVVTVTLDPTDGSYTVTQNLPILHADGNDENNEVFTLDYTVTDGDGDTATSSLVINVDDDTPIANPDTFNQINENEIVTGDVSANDLEGADTPATYAVVGTAPTGLAFNSDGTFTFTPADGQEGTVTFDYTVTDADNDTQQATVTINLQPDSDPSAAGDVAGVDDDGLPGNNPNDPPADDFDSDADDTGAGLGDESVFVGNLNGSFGNDTPGSYSFASGPAMLGLEAITLTWDDNTDTLTASSTRGDIFTIVVDQATGDYTLTLLQNVLHTGGDNGEVREFLNLGYFAIDSEGEVSPIATLVMVFGDDAPSASTNATVEIDDDAVGGNPGGVGDDPDATAATGTLDHVFGADGGTIAFDTASTLPAGFRMVADPASDGVIIEQEQGAGNWVAVVTVALDEDTGAYTVTQTDNVLHAAGGDENNTVLTLDYIVTDGDGDTADSSLVISIDDDTPAPSAVVTPASTAMVDETDLAEGAGSINLGSFAQGIDTDVGTNPTVIASTTTGNVLSYTGNFGADGAAASGALSYSLDIANVNTGLLTTDGTLIQLVAVSDTVVVGVIAGINTAAFAFEIDPATGVVAVEQYVSLYHLDPAAANDVLQLASGTLTAVVTATDADGDSVDSTGVDITSLFTFVDDAPSAFDPVDLTDTDASTASLVDDALLNTGTASATRLLNDPDGDGFGTDFIGSDGFGTLTFVNGTDGDPLMSGTEGVTADGDPVYLFGFGTDTLVATTDPTNSDASQTVFTMTLDPGTGAGSDATYTIDFDRTIDDGSGTLLSDFGAIRPNNYDWVGFTSEGTLFDGIDNDGEDILITAYNPNTGVAGTVNMSSTDIGSNNQWVDNAEAVRIDFVIDGTGAGDEKVPQAYGFDDHFEVTNASFSIIDVKSAGTNAQVTVALYNDDDSGVLQDLDGAPVAVAAGSVVVTDSAGNDITGTGATVVYNGDGTVTISGLQSGDNVAFVGDVVFNAFTVEHAGGNDFSLGAFGFSSAISGSAVPMSFDVEARDGDGDPVVSNIDVTVVPDPGGAPATTAAARTSAFSSFETVAIETLGSDPVNDNNAFGNFSQRSLGGGQIAAAGFGLMAFSMETSANSFGFEPSMQSFSGFDFSTPNFAIATMAAFEGTVSPLGNWMPQIEALEAPMANSALSTGDLAASNGLAEFGGAALHTVEFAGSSEFVADLGGSAAPMMAMHDGGASMMEALLTMPQQAMTEADLAQATGLVGSETSAEAGTILADVMAGNTIDAMLDHIAGDAGDIPVIGNEMTDLASYLGSDALTQTIDGGAFAYDNGTIVDTHEDAAALAAAGA